MLLISGVAQGCIYGLIALGFVLIYKATETGELRPGRADDAGHVWRSGLLLPTEN